MGKHEDLPIEASHFAHAFSYADEAARAADTGRVAGDVGKLAIQLSDWSIWILTSTTPTWEPACKKAVFGTQWGYEDFPAEQSTTSSSYQPACTCNFTLIEAGVFKINRQLQWKYSTANSSFKSRFSLDGVVLGEMMQEPKDATNWHAEFGTSIHSLTVGSHSFLIEYACESSGKTASVRGIHIERWRVS